MTNENDFYGKSLPEIQEAIKKMHSNQHIPTGGMGKESRVVIDYCKFHSFLGSEHEARGCASCTVTEK